MVVILNQVMQALCSVIRNDINQEIEHDHIKSYYSLDVGRGDSYSEGDRGGIRECGGGREGGACEGGSGGTGD